MSIVLQRFANAAGVLQFYTGGNDVYNRLNQITARVSPLLAGGGSIRRSVLTAAILTVCVEPGISE
jgi:hypothetical protein